jgi:hypothetical protein
MELGLACLTIGINWHNIEYAYYRIHLSLSASRLPKRPVSKAQFQSVVSNHTAIELEKLRDHVSENIYLVDSLFAGRSRMNLHRFASNQISGKPSIDPGIYVRSEFGIVSWLFGLLKQMVLLIMKLTVVGGGAVLCAYFLHSFLM